MRVLLIAEAANPEWVSVPLVGWSMVDALRQVADVHIVTQTRNRDAFLRAGLIEGTDFTAIDNEALARPLWKLSHRLTGGNAGWTLITALSSLSYSYFEHLLWWRMGKDIRAGKFDLVHRVTPLSPAISSPIAARCARAGIPFILGPLNGGVPWPKGFSHERRREKEWLSHIRGIYRLLPGRSRMLHAASAIICGSRFALDEVPASCQDKAVWLPENGIDPGRFNRVAPQTGQSALRACFVGRLVPLKGVDMAIEAALPLLRSGQLAFDIIGDGPQADALRALVRDEGVGNAVHFHGWKDHTEVQMIASQSQLLLFPSIREFGGGAVLEAMALGVVPVVADYAGPGELVDDATGFRIPMGTRPELVARLRAQLQDIAADPSVLADMAAAGRARVMRDFTWAAKAGQIRQIWQDVLTGRSVVQKPLPLPADDAGLPELRAG